MGLDHLDNVELFVHLVVSWCHHGIMVSWYHHGIIMVSLRCQFISAPQRPVRVSVSIAQLFLLALPLALVLPAPLRAVGTRTLSFSVPEAVVSPAVLSWPVEVFSSRAAIGTALATPSAAVVLVIPIPQRPMAIIVVSSPRRTSPFILPGFSHRRSVCSLRAAALLSSHVPLSRPSPLVVIVSMPMIAMVRMAVMNPSSCPPLFISVILILVPRSLFPPLPFPLPPTQQARSLTNRRSTLSRKNIASPTLSLSSRTSYKAARLEPTKPDPLLCSASNATTPIHVVVLPRARLLDRPPHLRHAQARLRSERRVVCVRRRDGQAQRGGERVLLGALNLRNLGAAGLLGGGLGRRCVRLGVPRQVTVLLPAADGCDMRRRMSARADEHGISKRRPWSRTEGQEERTRHQAVAEVVLAVLVRLHVLPLEVCAAAAEEKSRC